jgi:HTH-type transcriptional regulator/antitoxin HigA
MSTPDWAVHPGEVIEEALAERGWPQNYLADLIGYSAKHLNQVVRGRVRLHAPMAVEIEKHLGLSARLLMRMQADYDVWNAERVLTGS